MSNIKLEERIFVLEQIIKKQTRQIQSLQDYIFKLELNKIQVK